jgi:hypothetical protein
MMDSTSSRLQNELTETKAELKRLRESLALGPPTLHKDLSLVPLIPKWSGSDSTVNLEEFLSSVEAAARICMWQNEDKREIAVIAHRIKHYKILTRLRDTLVADLGAFILISV